MPDCDLGSPWVSRTCEAHTRIYNSLQRFLSCLDIPFVAQFSDSQTYLQPAQQGLGIRGMRSDPPVQREVVQWHRLLASLEVSVTPLDRDSSPSATG